MFRYCTSSGAVIDKANPNGSLHNIVGIVNEESNVAGMAPHPQRDCEELIGGCDGNQIFESIAEFCKQKRMVM